MRNREKQYQLEALLRELDSDINELGGLLMSSRLVMALMIGGTLCWVMMCLAAIVLLGGAEPEYTPVTPIPMEWPTATPEPIQTNPSMCTGCHYTLPVSGA